MRRAVGWAAFAAGIATIYTANYLIQHYGVVHVGFGLMAPAGVFAAGFAFTFRDLVQRTLGKRYVVLMILCGAAASFTVSASFALASATAFLVSELADFSVYTPLEKRSWVGAVLLSNTVGAMVDSYLFLSIAFGSLTFFWGQVVGKMWTVLPVVAAYALMRGYRRLATA